jgi:hypothetical protein
MELMKRLALVAIFGMLTVGCLSSGPVQWEYKVITADSDLSRTGPDAMSSFTVKVDDATLNELGMANGELVGSYVEHNTSFPNFGNDEYVTGIRPNVRPSAVVFTFKRPLIDS